MLDGDCGPAERCTKVRPFENLNADRHCVPVGPGLRGDACELALDCDSGVCVADTCLPSCQTQADSPSGLACAPQTVDELGCRIVEDVECGASCGSGEFCTIADGCVAPCRTSAQCSSGRCVRSTYAPEVSYCDGDAPPCEDNEFGFGEGHDDTMDLCFVDTPCWTDADCASPYACTIPKTSSNNIAFTAGFCARPN